MWVTQKSNVSSSATRLGVLLTEPVHYFSTRMDYFASAFAGYTDRLYLAKAASMMNW